MAKRKRSKRANGEGTVYQTSSGKWRAEFTVRYASGKQVRKRVRADTKEEAVRKRDALKAQSVSGFKADEKTKLEDYFRKWLRHKRADVKPRTLANYQEVLDWYATPKIGQIALGKLETQDIDDMMAELAEEVSKDCANRTRRVLHNALNQAVAWKLIAHNPAEATKPKRQEARQMTLWTPEQTVRFLETVKALQHSYPFDQYHAFYLIMSSGLRCGYSDANRPLIPKLSGHRFRSKPATDSD